MTAYSTKKALVDLGFVNGYFYSRPSNIDDDGWFDTLMDAFSRTEQIIIKGSLLEADPKESDYRQFLCDLGFIRGWAWLKAVPDAVSDALNRLIHYFSETIQITEIVFAPPKPIEPPEKMISDDLRHEISEDYRKWPEVSSIADIGGIPLDVVERVLEPIRDHAAEEVVEAQLAAEDEIVEQAESESVSTRSPPAALTKGTREWTPDQRAAQADRARGRKKPPFDSDFDSVKVDFDTGMSTGAIGRKWGCSDTHIRNFLTRHGVDPRRSKNPPRAEVSENQETVPNAQGSDSIGADQAQQPHDQDVDSDAGDIGDAFVEDESQFDGDAAVSEPDLESRRITAERPNPAGKQDERQLTDSDWPDIKEMLAQGRDQKLIASDYDVDPEDLHFFIASNQRREAKQPPGEARAPLPR